MEEKRPDEMEMAAQEDKKRKEKEKGKEKTFGLNFYDEVNRRIGRQNIKKVFRGESC